MLDLNKHSYLKYILFTDLYIPQGFQFAMSTVVIVLLFNDRSIPIETTTFISGIAALPWVLKFIFGPTIDFFNNRGRKFFIILGGILSGLSCITISLIDPANHLLPFTALLFLSHIGTITIDVATDAWAIQVTTEENRGKINAAMIAGLFGGTAIGSIIFTTILTFYGFEITFITCGLLVLLTILLPIIVKEEKIEIIRKAIKELVIKEFKKKNTQLIAFFGFFVALSFGMFMFVMPDYMINVLQLTKIQTGLISSVYTISIVIGAIVGGTVSDKIGRKKPLFIMLAFSVVFSALLIFADTWELFSVLYGLIGFTIGGASFSILMSLYMDVTNPKIAGTQFSFLTSCSNFGEITIAMFSGFILAIVGYHRFFLFTALLVGPAIIILYLITEKRRKS